ncbi:MAG: Hpt domain-containing protein [Novosphingopyxis baekryungensis]|jgi:HPt (histidine-containing phosphotransfer) domain-containing protein|uniref:Hpt domain-containing protein n=1 Tax=Novosphingopyxis baekryungensis TaxID=279369 RepID=UPI0003B6EF5C|nr:Hpt domain-containing protein [Novosphingopyxis baekryungensis]MDE0933539.1 Hpt domain-containing protein [Novosphingopyxis baekryungensis]
MKAFIAPVPGAHALLDQEQLDELIDTIGFEPFMDFVQSFIAELRLRPRIIGDHFAKGDRDATRSSAHYFKGAALSVGAARVAALTGAIERAPEDDTGPLIAQLHRASMQTEQAIHELIDA